MTFVSFDSFDEDGRVHAVLRLKNERNGIAVAVHTIIDGTPCFERYVEIVNLGERPAAVSRLAPLSGAVEQTDLGRFAPGTPVDGIYELGYFGRPDSEKKRRARCERLSLPPRLSANALVKYLSTAGITKEKLK